MARNPKVQYSTGGSSWLPFDERATGWFYLTFRPMPKPPDRLRAAAPRSASLASNEWRVEHFGAKVG
jgi:hypothetical protein